jgi:hypothetical protein
VDANGLNKSFSTDKWQPTQRCADLVFKLTV